MTKNVDLLGLGKHWVRLKGNQGWKNILDNTIWKKNKLHQDHWDVMDRKGRKIKEIDFYGKQIWPCGTKNLKANTPYTQYQNTEEWLIIEYLLKELEKNQDIELKTALEYIIGYLVEKLRNKDLLKTKEKEVVSLVGKRVSNGVNLRLSSHSR